MMKTLRFEQQLSRAARFYFVLFFILLAGASQGQTSLTVVSPRSQTNGYFGIAGAVFPSSLPGVPGSVLTGASHETALSGQTGAGRAYVLDALTGAQIRAFDSPNPETDGGFSRSVAVIADLNGDGVADIIIGAPHEDPSLTVVDGGRVYLFSGADGSRLRTLVSPNPETSGLFGASVAAVGDVDGDGIPDIVIGAPGEAGAGGAASAGRAYIISGVTGQVIHALNSPKEMANGSFGSSVAGLRDANGDSYGDVIIGAPGEESAASGHAYIFSGRTGLVLWTLTSPYIATSGHFGISVAAIADVTGDGSEDIVIGASGENLTPSPTSTGLAHLFNGVTGAYVRTLVSPNRQAGGNFGGAVASAGDMDLDGFGDVVAGASGESVAPGLDSSGRAYLFSGSSGRLIRTFASLNPQIGGNFGFGVAGAIDPTSTGRVLAGAYGESPDTTHTAAGRLYSFTVAIEPPPIISGRVLTAAGLPVPDVTMLVSNGIDNALTDANGRYQVRVFRGWTGEITPAKTGHSFNPHFRSYDNVNADLANQNFTAIPPVSVAISGQITYPNSAPAAGVTISTSDNLSSASTDANGAYTLNVPYYWSGAIIPAKFGVSFAPDRLTFTSLTVPVAGQDFTASNLMIHLSGAIITLTSGIAPMGVTLTAAPATGLAVSTVTAVTTSAGVFNLALPYGWSGVVTPSRTGFVFVPASLSYAALTTDVAGASFAGSAPGSGLFLSLSSPIPQSGGAFGASVALVPAAPGSITSDILIGASHESYPLTSLSSGRVHLFRGQTGALIRSLDSATPETDGSFGRAVASIPDMNGDGIAEIAVGARNEDPVANAIDGGRVYIYSGSDGTRMRTLASPNQQPSGLFGAAVAAIPDVDGDGLADIAVGAPGESGLAGASRAGRVYIFSGATGQPIQMLLSPHEGANGYFGISLAGLKDVDGDGAGDLAIGAYGEQTNASGNAYIYSGKAGQALWTLVSPRAIANGRFGFCVAAIPDVSGNGREDIAVGAYGESLSGSPAGSGLAHIFDGVTGAFVRTLASPNPEDTGQFGLSLAGAGDMDLDGYGDLIIGASGETAAAGSLGSGRAYLFSGATGWLLKTFVSLNPQPGGSFGIGVAGVVDNAAAGRVIVGANGESQDEAFPASGQAYIFNIALEAEPVISGSVLTVSGAPVLGVTMAASNNGASAVTDANGQYKTRVWRGWSGEITPVKPAHTFEPHWRSYSDVTADVTNQTFTATLPASLAISGRIAYANGAAVEGVIVATNDSLTSAVTDINGAYSLSVPYDWSGAIIPQKFDISFVPGRLEYTSLTIPMADQNFTAFNEVVHISGAIVLASGDSPASVTIAAVPSTDTVTTASPVPGAVTIITTAAGTYDLTLPYGWSGTVTPSRTGFGFVPINRSYAFLITDATTQTFTAGPLLTISGSVLTPVSAVTTGLSGVSVIASDPSLTAVTDTAGGYAFTVPYGWSGWVAPINRANAETSYNFTPPLRAFSGITTSVSRVNFLAWNVVRDQVDLSVYLPPVDDQRPLNIRMYGPDDFSQGFGAGVCWAMGYYAKTFNEAKRLGKSAADLASDKLLQISPWFLYNNGGAGSFHFTGEILTGYGAASMQTYGAQTTTTLAGHFAEAAGHKALAYQPIFVHAPATAALSTGLSFKGYYDNSTSGLIGLLRGGNCFILGLPVLQTFLTYSSGVYDDANATGTLLYGYQAVCVTGYDPAHNAFKFVNSWGTNWGLGGYGWISAQFVRRFAVEAWRIQEPYGFDSDLTRLPMYKGLTQTQWSKDYEIVYRTRGLGKLSVTSAGVIITGGEARDTLRIVRRVASMRGETIPAIRSDSSLQIYTQAPVGAVEVAGVLNSLTASNCHAESVQAAGIGRITMTAQPNATWFEWANRIRTPDFKLSNRAFTRIVSTAPVASASGGSRLPATVVNLNGVTLNALIVPDRRIVAAVNSRKNTLTGRPTFVSAGGVQDQITTAPAGAAALGGGLGSVDGVDGVDGVDMSFAATSAVLTGIYAGQIQRLAISGAKIDSWLIADILESRFAASLSARGAVFVSNFRTQSLRLPFVGGIEADMIQSGAKRLSVSAPAGDLAIGSLWADGEISALKATFKPYRDNSGVLRSMGGYAGLRNRSVTTPTAMSVVISGLAPQFSARIPVIQGDLGVRGVFYAGATEDASATTATPNSRGIIARIVTLKNSNTRVPADIRAAGGPFIEGAAWSDPSHPPRLIGDVNAITAGRFKLESGK
ncbi:MAG: FG-GAP-like repeat-containing protein [Candidatus Sumerlaeota bacterium]|nr:FG-GAP-like repeat-containing protein [Candidatus Sumerlaeota bacterium]